MRPIVVEGRQEQFDRALAPQDHGVVGLHEEATPGEVGRPAHDRLHLRPVDHDGLVVLKLPHVLPLHVARTGRSDQALLRLRLSGMRLAMGAIVVDDHLDSAPELFET